MAQPVSAERLRTLRLQERVFRFACGVVSQCPNTITHLAAREIWRHLVAAVVSTSNNLEEADEASSHTDFVAKMKIALREAKEARRCMRFVVVCGLSQSEALAKLEDEARQLVAIFATIVINTKRRLEHEKASGKKLSKAK
jgi:four helix bundle protein